VLGTLQQPQQSRAPPGRANEEKGRTRIARYYDIPISQPQLALSITVTMTAALLMGEGGGREGNEEDEETNIARRTNSALMEEGEDDDEEEALISPGGGLEGGGRSSSHCRCRSASIVFRFALLLFVVAAFAAMALELFSSESLSPLFPSDSAATTINTNTSKTITSGTAAAAGGGVPGWHERD